MKNTQLKGFSFVEILMIITILALISVVAYTSFGVRQNKAVNTKIQSEVISLSNALLLAKQENNTLPQPQGNRNFFAEDTSYVHDYEDSNTFGVHGFITHNTLAKKYIDIVPVDPRTGSFYAYGKTKKNGSLNEMYEIASVIWDTDIPKSYVTGDYTAENGPLNLIREYNGPDFVYEDSTLHFPYNPNERVLTATIDSYTGSVTINGLNTYSESELLSFVLKSGDTIEVSQNGAVELYYSDGSRSVLGDSSNNSVLTLQKMEFIQDNNIITDIKLVLESGMIWNKAASLDDESGFEIYTTDSTAAVRGTIFGVQKNGNNSEIVVKKGKVAVNQNIISSAETIKEYIKNDDIIPSSPIISLPGIIDFDSTNQESFIEVINNNPEKGASIGITAISNNTGSIDDIPDDIVDTVINSTPIINNNIKFSLKEYSYSTNPAEINIALNIPKRVYESADLLLINGKDIIYKANNNWGNPAVLSGTIYTQILDNNTLAPTNIINESQLQTHSRKVNIPNNVTEFTPHNNTGIESNFLEQGPGSNATESFQSEHSFKIFTQVNASTGGANSAINLYDYITEQINQNNHDFTIQLGKKSLHGKIRLTEKVRFTLIDDKSYENEEDEDEKITEDEVKEEEDKKLAEKKGVEGNCDGFEFTNINGEDKCADADDNLVSNNWNLVAFAPYDNFSHEPNTISSNNREKSYGFYTSTGNINVHSLTNTISPTGGACKPKYNVFSFFNSACEAGFTTLIANSINFNAYSHLIQKNGETGIFIDNFANDSKLKYEFDSGFRNLENFVLEFNVRGGALKRTSGSYFLYNNVSDDIMLYLTSGDLKLKIDGVIAGIIDNSTITSNITNDDNYYKIYLISDNGDFKIKLGNNQTAGYFKPNIKLAQYQYIGVHRFSTTSQWNDILNYIKIYTK